MAERGPGNSFEFGESNYQRPGQGRIGNRNGRQQMIPIRVNQQFRGQNVLKLKQLLKQQQPGTMPKDMQLVAVKIIAKSKKGQGKATLVVGQEQGYSETIYGNPYDFHDDSQYTYDRVKLSNPSYDSQGKWQVKLQGNIKVKRVVLIVKKKMNNRGKTISVQLYGQQFRGLSTLKLKRLIKQQNPMINLQTAKIKKVVLVAKSKQGNGQASLVIGQSYAYPEYIMGSPRQFHSESPRSYSRVVLQNSSYDSAGKWQVELQGNIKVKEVIITIQTKRNSFEIGPVFDGPTRPRRGGGRS
jgi:hypothetical protein